MGVAPGISFGCYSAEGLDARPGVVPVKTGKPPESAGRAERPVGAAWSSLTRADDHRVNRVEGDCEQHPEDGGEEKAAHDFDYGVGGKEATQRSPVRTSAGEACVSGLQG